MSDHGADDEEARTSSTTLLHVSALDALVNVNSFLTGAVFIGLAFKAANYHSSSSSNSDSLVAQSECEAPADVARRMVVLEVLSFAFFMLSTLIAHGLKLQLALLSTTWSRVGGTWPLVRVNERATRLGMVATAVATVCGALCLTLSLVEVVQLKLGLLSCPDASSFWPKCAAFPLLACVLLGVSILTATVLHAFLK